MSFDWRAYLAQQPERLVLHPEGRRLLTRLDPLLFSLLYLRHHLSSDETDGQLSFSRFHLDFFENAKQWARNDLAPMEMRQAWVAPRGSGKSTLAFLLTPLWALAHGHRNFVSAFADSASQAEQHLTSVKREIDTNVLLRRDYPKLCTPATRPAGATVSDNRSLYVAESGAVFSAKGIDSSVLGAKVGNRRPDVLLFDDVEPSGSNYSLYQKEKRLATILDAILPMNDRAVCVLVGTVTMPGSIVHDVVKTVQQPDAPKAQWVVDEQVKAYAYPALTSDPETGEAESLWPERWPLAYLQSVAHTRSFKLNMMNDPMAADGDFWTSADFTYDMPPVLTHQLLSIDPAVSSGPKADFTALAVVGFCKPQGVAVIRHVRAVRIPPGEELRALVLRIIDAYPEIVGILVESNQGGEVWRAILHHMPVEVKTIHQHEPKEVRAARLLNHYQMRRVVHEKPLPALEEQCISFPKGANDDVVDAVGAGVQVFLGKKSTAGVKTAAYV